MTNKINNFFTLLSCVAIMALPSCKKAIDGAYQNPNSPVEVDIEQVLPGVIGGYTAFNSAAGTNYGLQVDDVLLGRYIQYWGSTANGENYGSMGGTLNSDNTGAIWATYYYGHGLNVNYIIDKGTREQKWDFVGVAYATRAWGMLEMTNQYVQAPLQQAFNPALDQFLYDDQPLWYDSCRKNCFLALENLNRTDGNVNPANLAQSDFYMNKGNIDKWKKFVYGILARSYIDLSTKGLFTSAAYVDSAIKYASLSMNTAADDMLATFSVVNSSNGFNSYFGPTRSNVGTIRQGKYIADLMSGANDTVFTGVQDPRAWYMLSENQNKTFKGVYPWLGMTQYLNGSTPTADYPKNFWRNPMVNATVGVNDSAKYVFSNEGPWPIMTASEMQFVIAEAYLKKNNKALAYTAYKNAISLNFDMLTTYFNNKIPAGRAITPASKAAFLADPKIVPPTAAGLTLSQVMCQKYIALFGWGTHQTWVDLRKYHYVDMDASTGTQVYAGFLPPPTAPINFLITTNKGQYVYRCRPRYNSEYLYNVPELTRIGAFQNLDYNTYKPWFALP